MILFKTFNTFCLLIYTAETSYPLIIYIIEEGFFQNYNLQEHKSYDHRALKQ